jgi:hypothetical protein
MNIEDICNDIARKHASIIEEECKRVCEKFNCPSTDLIIEYHDQTRIKIRVLGSDFTIDNVYTVNG